MIKIDEMTDRTHIACFVIAVIFSCAGLALAQTTPTAKIQDNAISPQSVSAVAVTPDGTNLVVSRYSPNGNETRGNEDDSIEVWSLHSTLAPQTFATHLHPIRSLAFSHNSEWLGAASQGFETILDEPPAAPHIFVGKVYLWHVADAVEVKLSRPNIVWFYGNEGTYDEWSATSVAFSPDDKQVVADIFEIDDYPGYNARATFFDISKRHAVNNTNLYAQDSDIFDVWRRFSWLSPDGRRAFALEENRPVLFDTLNGKRLSSFAESRLYFRPSDQDECALGIHAFGFAAFQPDMRQVALANDAELEIRDARTGTIKARATFKETNNATRSLTAAFAPDGKALAVSRCGQNHEVRLYETSALQLRATWPVESVQTSLQFSPDGSLVFTAGLDGLIRFWDMEKLTLLATLLRSPSGEWVFFTPDGLYDSSPAGAALLVWHLNGRSVSASELPNMRQPGLLSALVGGKRPKPGTPLAQAIVKALPQSHD